MRISAQMLANLRFHLTHDCVPHKSRARFQPSPRGNNGLVCSRKAMVYVWLVAKDKEFHVLYAGKAGAGVSARLRQHEGGFINSTTGRKNLQRILDLFSEGSSIYVYARISDMYGGLLEKSVSLYATEEQAVIEAWEPELNRAGVVARRGEVTATGGEVAPVMNCEDGGFILGNEVYFDGVLGDFAVADFFGSINEDGRSKFLRLLKWAFGLASAKTAAFKVVKGYTGQPKGYNGVPMLLIAPVGKAGKAKPDKWLVRIPLICEPFAPLTVVLPRRTLVQAMDIKNVEFGRDPNFRPRNLGDFLRNPGRYTSLS